MSKDPAFLFYSKDWIEGTIEMLPQEKGVYIDLLAHQHQKGSLPIETNRLCRLVCMQEEEFLKIWEHIKNKFVEIQIISEPNGIPNGLRLVNQKLIDLSEKRKNDAFLKKISGIFASLIKSSKCNYQEKEYIKEKFKDVDFKSVLEENLKEKITDWFFNCIENMKPNGIPNGSPKDNQVLTSLAIANANINNTITNKEISIPDFQKVFEIFIRQGGTKEMAEAFFNKHNAMGWLINNTPISKWEFLVPNFVSNWKKNEEKNKNIQKAPQNTYVVQTPREDW